MAKWRFATGGLLFLLALSPHLNAQHHDAGPKPLVVFAPYWTAEPGWHTEFKLKNNLPSTLLVVTPVVRLSAGQELSLATVTIPPLDLVTVDVAQELETVAPDLRNQPGTFGSVAFRFTSFDERNLYAAVMVHEAGQPIGFHLDAVGPTTSSPSAAARASGGCHDPA